MRLVAIRAVVRAAGVYRIMAADPNAEKGSWIKEIAHPGGARSCPRCCSAPAREASPRRPWWGAERPVFRPPCRDRRGFGHGQPRRRHDAGRLHSDLAPGRGRAGRGLPAAGPPAREPRPPPDTVNVKLVFTEYDKGNAFARFMLAGLGQIRIGANVLLIEPANNQGRRRVRGVEGLRLWRHLWRHDADRGRRGRLRPQRRRHLEGSIDDAGMPSARKNGGSPR